MLAIGEWEDKCWGRTRCRFWSEFYSEHELDVSAGWACSLHYHLHRSNRFRVESGSVRIIEAFGPLRRETILGPDNIYDVPSLVVHRFEVIEAGRVIECYWPDRGGRVDLSDIVRLEAGGAIQPSTSQRTA